ncbi:Phospholipid-transporting ATPase [Fasciola hepatica]|uniref:Phospholipid-transporting ATPase n=1 Tax=Fasciola hepatica TaxID=6192 RepID=A0A4E0RFL8_FASHE|nr:Phospholipid-transporting ATPase [Fasciola hepatica]
MSFSSSDNLLDPVNGRNKSKYNCSFHESSCWNSCSQCCRREKIYQARVVNIGRPSKTQRFPSNKINNQKYNIFSFLPLVLFEQFSVFLNLIYLILALSQFIPDLRVGALYTYWGPLGFVLCVTLIREAIDDVRRWLRDREVNQTTYIKYVRRGETRVTSEGIKVGDLIRLDKDQRVPADMVLVWTSDRNGSCFIRTDQLDGETDWKLRHPIPPTHAFVNHAGEPSALFDMQAQVFAEAPRQNIHSFEGTFARTDIALPGIGDRSAESTEVSLNLDHTAWSNTVLATGSAVGLVIYTGAETRAVMNSSRARTKMGKIDREINNIIKLLFALVVVLALVMVALKGFSGAWYKYWWRFMVLFSYIIPLALRVNMDLAKIVYAFIAIRDPDLPGCMVRNTTIPEELGRISFLMSDKTGTLTQNEMVFKKLHLGSVAFAPDSMEEVVQGLKQHFESTASGRSGMETGGRQMRRTGNERMAEAVMAVAVCHNVTPMNEDNLGLGEPPSDSKSPLEMVDTFTDPVGYQASSPDEVALVSWTATVGITLVYRDQHYMCLRLPNGTVCSYDVLNLFPFSSESKRMGIILRDRTTRKVTFYVKGADTIMKTLVSYTDWLDDEAGNLAREGLRTLVVASRQLTEEQYEDFAKRYHTAKMSVVDRVEKMQAVVATLETELDVLCLTGVEDKLQEGVRPTLEALRNAGIRVWMLTGDKLETAECIAKSSRLVARDMPVYTFQNVTGRMDAHLELNAFRKRCEHALLITGSAIETCLRYYEHEFIELARQSPAVVVCRCSPTQKTQIVRLVRAHTGARVAAVGDGGNDVGMIQAADVGFGLVGKEGRQASLASDFSLYQFRHVARLLLVHGRNCYKNTAALALFVIHRGSIISVMQAVFSAVFYFVSVSLFPGFLLVGYCTVFTMFPVFSLVLDKDVPDRIAITYPELYKTLQKGREITFKTFFVWLLISIYQGGVIMYGALLLFEDEFIHVVSITFTALLLTELLMVAITIRTWHLLMILAEVISLAIYALTLVIMTDYFDPNFLRTVGFLWRVLAITAISCIPIIILKFIHYKFRPSIYSKLQSH